MKIICLLLCVFSLSTAKVYPRTGVNNDLGGVQGVMVDIPEYEDPEVSLFKLIASGIMPVYVRDAVKDSEDLSHKNEAPHHQTDDIKTGLDTVITQLQEAKNKLENGNNAIYFDIDKSVLSLEDLKQRLYADLHTVSTDQSLTYKVSTVLPLIYKSLTRQHLTYEVPNDKPLTHEDSTEQHLINKAPNDKPLAHSDSPDQHLSYASTDQTLTYSTSTDKPLIDTVSTDNPLNSSGPEQPPIVDGVVFSYIPKYMPRAEFSSYGNSYGDEMAEDVTDDVSSSEPEKAEMDDKTLIRERWSYKLSGMY